MDPPDHDARPVDAHRSDAYVTPSRANFMTLVMAAIFGFISLSFLGVVIAYLIPPKGTGARLQNLGPLSRMTFTAGVAGPFVYDATGHGDAVGVFAVKAATNPNQVARVLEQTCTHLGCPVAWVPAGVIGTFNCPCHGSIFSKLGQRIAGPAPRGLYHHAFYTKDGDLWVDGRQDP